MDRAVFFHVLFLLSLLFGGNLSAQSLSLETNRLFLNSFPLNPYVRVLDGQWLGITVASDGNCYFGSSTHDNRHGAAFFRYNPMTQGLTLLAEDLTVICGENPTNTPPQGKVHSDIVEFDGWLYFSTHLGNYWQEAEIAYTGGHLLGYEMATGNFRDFGVVRSNYTGYSAVGVDRVRHKLLAYVTRWWGATPDSHLYRIDIATGAKEDLGLVPGHTCYWFFVDARGDAWFSCHADNGSVRVVRSATGMIETFNNVLPEPELGNARWWDWAKALPDGNRCVFKLQFGNYLHIFDADALQTNGPTAAFTTIRNIGRADSGLALTSNRVFYVQRADRQVGWQEYTDFHLMSVRLDNGSILDHGLMMDQSGRLVWRLPGMTADQHGRVFGVGDWWLQPGEQGTPVGTLRHVDGPGTNYTALPRGEFLGVIDLSQSPTLHASRFLSLTTAGGGTVISHPNSGLFTGNAVVDLTAAPASGWTFLGWSGDTDGTIAQKSIVMTRDKAVQAVFGAHLNTSISGSGSILLDPPGGVYPYGTVVRVTAVPQPGHFFSQWNNASGSNLNPLLYTVTNGSANLVALFNPLPPGKVTLTVLLDGNGTVSISPYSNLYDNGASVTLEAIPANGQTFSGWGNDASGTNTPLSVTLTRSKVIAATFTERPRLMIEPLAEHLAATGFALTFTGELGTQYRVDATTNLTSWETLGYLTNVFGSLRFTDPVAGQFDRRFYRARELLFPRR